MASFIPSGANEREEMLRSIGCADIEELFIDLPEAVRLNRPLDLPSGMSEQSVRNCMEQIAGQNKVFKTIFRGAGAYNHYIPSIVKSVTEKEEFVTAYTPYQAEISQGILQSIFEYQTLICALTGMDVSNASVYDGATAAAEAAEMCRTRGKIRVLISGAVNPEIIGTVKTYCFGSDAQVEIIPAKDGLTDLDMIADAMGEDVSCVIVQQPNFFGLIEDAGKISELVHQNSAKLIMSCNPISLALVKTPAEAGADIAVGDGQPLGMPLSYGGPYLGYMACRSDLARKLPGRIVGQTTDRNGKHAFVLTLQAREQHIRREKASSNICSNQALCALTASVYINAMGSRGLRAAAGQCVSKAHYMASRLCEIPGVTLRYSEEFFHEFLTDCTAANDRILSALEEQGILGGLTCDGGILWCVTEQNTREEIDHAVSIVREACEK